MEYQLTLNWPDFLERHWQKRPVVLKRGFSNFIDPLSPDELAGLAMESEIDSRLVSHQDGKWQVSHGPFESYDHLGESNWSLLVQAVNHWHEPTAALMRPFRALPDWRIDDLMISFSVPGGGVGPHLDQYDVFIIQGTGRRRWRVGEKLQMRQHCPHPDLLQVEPFEAIIDEELEPGDILYIPPGFPHEGYALENAMNYSVGFRAPNSRELISGFADYVLQQLRKQMQNELKALQRKLGITFVFVTHDQEEALTMSDRIVVMRNGVIEQDGTPREIYEEPKNLFVAGFIGEINRFDATVIERLDEQRVRASVEGRECNIYVNFAVEPGQKLNVLLRPEDLRVEEINDDNHIEGLIGYVRERNYKGMTLESVVELENGKMVMVSEFFNEDDPDFDHSLDQKMAISWVESWEVVLADEEHK